MADPSPPRGARSRAEHLRDAGGRLSAADEVAWLQDQARAQWLAEHDQKTTHTLETFSARIAEVGEDMARDEVLAAAFRD
ncbi:hypothetical protein [Microbacterium enclense]|uniref:hypothetical protein n=1 Tax=Microbacterium enclense TaxID=993073 RepID=UPI003F80D4FC